MSKRNKAHFLYFLPKKIIINKILNKKFFWDKITNFFIKFKQIKYLYKINSQKEVNCKKNNQNTRKINYNKIIRKSKY